MPGWRESFEQRVGRVASRVGGKRLTPRGIKVATYSAGLALALFIVASLFAMHMSSTPDFCGSCHIMQPYYQSWKESKHNEIACVECHIPPGITAEFRKKYEALSMVARYFTGTYGTNPWAEVDDAACLRCHERRLLDGKELFHQVVFNHTPHLTETRRGLRLRCTSCHGQIVQGSHIAVTATTCALCHFKGNAVNSGIGRCMTCHEIPERVVSAAGTEFDHSQVRRLDLACQLCHENVVRGVGNVPRERCLTCHNQKERLAEYGETDFLHRQHVTDHKVDCLNCHLEIEHGRAPNTVAQSASECSTCHGSGHSPQQDLYTGIGGRGVPRMPSPMFAAGVKCEGCHNASVSAFPASSEMMGSHSLKANVVSCMSCHGPSYKGIYEAWQRGVASRVGALKGQMNATAAAVGVSAGSAWDDAQHNFRLVERGKGIHNVNFAFALLDKAHEQMNEARRARGLGALAKPWPTVAAGAQACLTCHQGIESQTGTFGGRHFSHTPHVASAKLDCTECHRPHAERAPGEVVRFGPDGCMPCHHRNVKVGIDECMTCHKDVSGRTVTSFRGEFSHEAHLEMGLDCQTCHDNSRGDPRPARSVCTDCHVD